MPRLLGRTVDLLIIDDIAAQVDMPSKTETRNHKARSFANWIKTLEAKDATTKAPTARKPRKKAIPELATSTTVRHRPLPWHTTSPNSFAVVTFSDGV